MKYEMWEIVITDDWVSNNRTRPGVIINVDDRNREYTIIPLTSSPYVRSNAVLDKQRTIGEWDVIHSTGEFVDAYKFNIESEDGYGDY